MDSLSYVGRLCVSDRQDPARYQARLSGADYFLVDFDSPRVTRDDIHGKLGVRAGSTSWISFQDVRVPADNMIVLEGEGFKVTMLTFDNGRNTVAAGSTSLIRAAIEESAAYTQDHNASFEAATEAIQIHGAYGFSDEYNVERYLRNAKEAMIYEDSNEVQRLIQAGYVLRERADKRLRKVLPAYDPEFWSEA